VARKHSTKYAACALCLFAECPVSKPQQPVSAGAVSEGEGAPCPVLHTAVLSRPELPCTPSVLLHHWMDGCPAMHTQPCGPCIGRQMADAHDPAVIPAARSTCKQCSNTVVNFGPWCVHAHLITCLPLPPPPPPPPSPTSKLTVLVVGALFHACCRFLPTASRGFKLTHLGERLYAFKEYVPFEACVRSCVVQQRVHAKA
jgi:hypothetical protein